MLTATKLALAGAVALTVPAIGEFGVNQAAATETMPDNMVERFGAWRVECVADTASDNRFCRMAQVLTLKGQRRPVLSAFVRIDDGNIDTMTFVAPLGLKLSEGVEVTVSETSLFTAEFETCQRSGCIAQTEISSNEIVALSRGEIAKITFVGAQGKPVNIEISLDGFTAARARLEAVQ